jgi:hypothetical protein
MAFIETLTQSKIAKKKDAVTSLEPKLLKLQREQLTNDRLKKANECFSGSSFPSLIDKLKGLIDDLKISQEEQWYDNKKMFDPHVLCRLTWDRKPQVSDSFEYRVHDTWQEQKEVDIAFFPEKIIIKGDRCLGTTCLKGDKLTNFQLQEKALGKAYKHPAITKIDFHRSHYISRLVSS